MNEKIENILMLALETDEEEREQTQNLNVGFDDETKRWEVIVKYHGSLDELVNIGVSVEYLIAGYAILNVPEGLVESVAALEQIEYVEKPKKYYYSELMPSEYSCILPLRLRETELSGKGVLIAILDSGIDYSRDNFKNSSGETRIRFLWDQTLEPDWEAGLNSPEGFNMGVEFDGEQINRALSEGRGFDIVPSLDTSGHGTAVAGIAASSIQSSAGYSGVAYASELIIVKLGRAKTDGFPRTTEIMRGVVYALQKAGELNMPLVINLSFGNSYGAHDGSSLLERFLDNASEKWRTVICVGSGNEGDAAGHLAGNVADSNIAELSVASYEQTLNVQLWKNYSDKYNITLISPGGEVNVLPDNIENGKYVLRAGNTMLLIFFGEPSPYSVAQEIYIDMIPRSGRYIDSGIWTFVIEAEKIVTGNYYFYLMSGGILNEGTGFYRPTPNMTMTIPSTSSKVLTVGAYDTRYDTYAAFSGRGYADAGRTIGVVSAGLTKPDLVAPGVGITAPNLYGGYTAYDGTSFATPIVSGSAALLMEWGIVRGNDPFLYGEKVKAYLRAGAEPLRGESEYPNDRVGYGKLCVANSLPVL
ncbi:MAG: S8 family serine peptidase [Lachnospiraceae bacterium]|nr:S8 family serine peptidase [Lachnospiraceae bacterium]